MSEELGLKLIEAIKNESIDEVISLIDRGADVNFLDPNDGETPLITAIQVRNIEIIDILIQRGADVNKPSKFNKMTPIDYIEFDDIEDEEFESTIYKILIVEGAKPTMVTESYIKYRLELFIEVVEANNIDIVLQIIDSVRDKKISLNKLLSATQTSSSLKITPLIMAVKNQYKEIVKILLDAGRTFTLTEKHVNSTTRGGNSALFYAVNNQDIELIQLLIEYGADVNNINVNATTILDQAKKKASEAKDRASHDIAKDIIQILVDAGAQMKPLRIFYDIVEENHLKVSPKELEQLLESKLIDLDEIEKSEYSRHNILTYILDVGPEKNLWDGTGFNRDPEEKREMIGKFKSTFDILIRYGIDVNFKTANGRSALEFLLSDFPIEMNEILVPMLLDEGAYLTPEEVRYPEMVTYVREVSERIGREIPIEGIKTPEDLKSNAVKLATEEFSSSRTHRRRLDELIRTLNDAHDKFDQTYMPLDIIIDQLFLAKKIRYQMMELLFPEEIYKKIGFQDLHIPKFFSKYREIQYELLYEYKQKHSDNTINIGKILKLMLPFMKALTEEDVSNDEPEREVSQQELGEMKDSKIKTIEIKYDKKLGKHVTEVIDVKDYKDRLKSLKDLNKVNRTFDTNEKITQIDEILTKLSDEPDISKITSHKYLLDLIKVSEQSITLLTDSFKDLRYLFEFHGEVINGPQVSMSDFYGFDSYTTEIPSLNSNTVWLLQLLTLKTVHHKEIMSMGLEICLDILKSKSTSEELELLAEIITNVEAEVSPSMGEEEKWSKILKEILKTAKGVHLVEKILKNFSRIGCLEPLLHNQYPLKDNIWSATRPQCRPIQYNAISRFLYTEGNDHSKRPELYDVNLLKEELLSYNKDHSIEALLVSVKEDRMKNKECVVTGHHNDINDYELLEAELLNICFDLKRTLCQCTAVFLHNKEEQQRQEEKRLDELSEGRMKVILKREKLEDKSLEELLDIARVYGAPNDELLEMIRNINYAADYELPYVRGNLLNYMLSFGPMGDGTGGQGLQPEILRQRLLDSYQKELQVLEARNKEKETLRLAGLNAIAVRYKGSERLPNRELYAVAINHCRPYIQEVQVIERLSRRDAVSVEVSMQPFLHRKALEKLSEIKSVPLSKLRTELEKASMNDPLRTEIYKKMCELSAKGEYKLPTTPTERVLRLKPSDQSQKLSKNILKKDNLLQNIFEDELKFTSSSGSDNPDDLYYGYPEDLDKKLDMGSIKKMINEVLEFRNDPLDTRTTYTRDPLKIFLKYGLDLEKDRELIEELYEFFEVQDYTRFNDVPPPPAPPPAYTEHEEELPPDWERRINPSNGTPYYVNHVTGERSDISPVQRQNMPLEDRLRELQLQQGEQEPDQELPETFSQGSSVNLGPAFFQGDSEEIEEPDDGGGIRQTRKKKHTKRKSIRKSKSIKKRKSTKKRKTKRKTTKKMR